jgi:hypothetical protein
MLSVLQRRRTSTLFVDFLMVLLCEHHVRQHWPANEARLLDAGPIASYEWRRAIRRCGWASIEQIVCWLHGSQSTNSGRTKDASLVEKTRAQFLFSFNRV